MAGGELHHQIDTASRTAAACLVETRTAGIGDPPVNGPSCASSLFVRGAALALTNAARRHPPLSLGGHHFLSLIHI